MKQICTFRLPLLAAFLLSTSAGCVFSAMTGATGSGNVITLEQEFSDFNRVEAGYGCRLNIQQGNSFSVTVRIDDNMRDRLDIRQDGNRLRIGLKRSFISFQKTFEVDVTMPDLEDLQLSGGSRGQVNGFDFSHELELGLSGGSRLEASLSSGDLEISLSGGSRAELEGSGGRLRLDGSGGAEARLQDFKASDVEVSLSGGSSATVSVEGELSGGASGGSSVYYSGNPSRVSVSKSGGAKVVQR